MKVMNEINPEYGYRLLELGTIINIDDEYFDYIQQQWTVSEPQALGHKIGPAWAPHRRKIDVGEGYRLLPVGEKTIEGDQYQSPNTGKWYLASDKFVSDWAAYRRKVETITGNYLVGCFAGTALPPADKATFYVRDENGYIDPDVYSTEEEARIEAQRRAVKYGTPQLVLRAVLRTSIETTVTTIVTVLH